MAFDESKIDPGLLARRRAPGGCPCEKVGADGRCVHCGCRVHRIEVGPAMTDIMLPRLLDTIGAAVEEASGAS